jgi:rubrerythrin
VKTTSITSSLPPELRGLTTLKFPVTLANVYDEKAHAISFYFSRASFSETSHEEEVLNAKHLVNRVKTKCSSEGDTADLSRDLAMILEVEQQIRATPARFKAVFACGKKQIWQEYDLPICENVSRLEVATHFQLVPLLRALESCTPYCVVIVENGKAKGFLIHGAEIHELDARLPAADLSVHADDSRVGWSHHIDSNVSERRKAYMRELAADLHRLLQGTNCEHLVIGCREEVWSELEPELAKAGLAAMVAGRFHLASFDLTPAGILQAARPVFDEWQREYYAEFWLKVREQPAHSAVGVEPVLRSLESGRVQKLCLGNVPDTELYACAGCNTWWSKADEKCPACGNTDVYAIAADELLLRKALLTDAEILAPDAAIAASLDPVGALLRY